MDTVVFAPKVPVFFSNVDDSSRQIQRIVARPRTFGRGGGLVDPACTLDFALMRCESNLLLRVPLSLCLLQRFASLRVLALLLRLRLRRSRGRGRDSGS